MRRSAPDHSQRRVIAQLASLGEEDLRLVLGELSPAQRRAAERMLQDAATNLPSDASDQPAFSETGLAPWLVDCLRGEGDAEQAMTVSARALLRTCSERLPGAGKGRSEEPSRSLLGRIGDAFAAPKAAA